MQLNNSEVLLLSQILFYIKSLPSQNWDVETKINDLYVKVCSHLVPGFEKNNAETQYCGTWHEESCEDENTNFEISDDTIEVSHKKLLELDALRVDYKGKRTLTFEDGISSKCTDITLDDGDEILCDVTELERNSNTLRVNCAEGWVTFDVSKFPKSWTGLLEVKTLYKVVQ